MEDDLGSPAGHELDHLGRTHVHLVDGQLVAGAGPGVGQVGQGAGRQVVDHVDGMSLGQQPVDQGRTDEPGPAGDQRAHRQTPAATRSPSMTVPDAVTAPPPITDTPWITQRWPTMASRPDDRSLHRGPGRHPGPGKQDRAGHRRPLLDHRAGPDHRLLDDGVGRHRRAHAEQRAATVELWTSTAPMRQTPGPTARSSSAPGAGGPGRRPRMRSWWARR